MAQCNVQDLMAQASGFMGMDSGQLQVAITELLCQIKGGDCTPATLMAEATQFAGLSPGQLLAVQTQLICNWRG